MTSLFKAFWSAMLFASIAWYAILLVYVGVKGGREIAQIARNLGRRNRGDGD